MAAAAKIEWNGIPIDVDTLTVLRLNWTSIQDRLIAEIDRAYGIYDGRTFMSIASLLGWQRRTLPGPRCHRAVWTSSDDTFRDMARSHRRNCSDQRTAPFAVADCGCRTWLWVRMVAIVACCRRLRPRPAATSRSNSRFIFGPAVWLRGLIRPEPDHAVAYLDYEQQEFGIAAALSKDEAMQMAYASGDPYLAFAKQAGAVPQDATKASHKQQRDQFKACVLAVQYGMGSKSLAERIDQSECQARETVAVASADVSNVLEMVKRGGRSCHAAWLVEHSVRLACPCRP